MQLFPAGPFAVSAQFQFGLNLRIRGSIVVADDFIDPAAELGGFGFLHRVGGYVIYS